MTTVEAALNRKQLIVRQAEPCEAEAIHTLVQQAMNSYADICQIPSDKDGTPCLPALKETADDVRTAIKKQPFLICRNNCRIIGTARLDKHAEQGVLLLERFAVADEYRGKGVGKKIIQAATVVAHRSGCHHIRLVTAYGNFPPLKFYQKLGFKIAEIDTCGQYARAVMQLDLCS